MRKSIPLQDKELIKDRLARGVSTREAIKGTSATSNNTAVRIARDEALDIAQIRANYLKQIEDNRANQPERAKLWAEMTRATKIHTSHTEPDREVEDWQAREKALKYIDTIAGIHTDKPASVAIGFFQKDEYNW